MKDILKKRSKELKGLLVGILLTIIVVLIIWPKRIAKLENGQEVAATVGKTNITADNMYDNLRNKYGVDSLIELIDRAILDEKYTLTEEDNKSIKETAENYYKNYETYYQLSKEEFLKQYNFGTEENFLKYLELDYKRSKYVEEYLIKNVTDKEIDSYYKESYFAPFKVEHILVKTGENMTTDEAKAKIEKIIKELNKGTSWEKIKTKYKSDITTESFNVEFDSSYEESFTKAAKALKDGKYSTTPVQTTYGYHVIYRIETLDKEEISNIKDRLVSKVVQKKKTENTNYYQKTLIIMRDEAGFEIKDSSLNKMYETFKKSLNK